MTTRTWIILIAGSLVLVILVVAGFAEASQGGRVGFSGNPATNGGHDCTACHSPDAALPTVSISGPTVVDAGTTNSYVVTLTGGPSVTGGFNASTSGFAGIFSSVDAETEVIAGEITHNSPKPFSTGQVQFTFNWTAPASNGEVTMYAAGNSTNDLLNTAGDGVSTTTLPIVVQNGDPNPTATPLPPAAAISLQQVASGLAEPVVITNAFDQRLFIAQRNGLIRIVDASGALLPTPFLDLSANVLLTADDQGLLGLAFSPDYVNDGYFYIYYIYDPPGQNNDRTRISRFTRSAINPNLANPASELILMEFEQPYRNHNAGDMHFGEDGYLYIASGDGGGSVWAPLGGPPMMYSQDPDDLLGKMLRIDVDTPPGVGTGPDCNIAGGMNYSIPPGNAFTNGPGNGCDEIWAFGLRNPWRFSFDRSDGSGWIADVGQSFWEEVEHFPGDAVGLNYGWSCFEGTHPASEYYDFFDYTECQPASAYDMPAYQLIHAIGDCSITGGFVYRGAAYPDLTGAYFFSDYCRPSIRTLTGSSGSLTETTVLPVGSFSSPSTFGEDVLGEIYVANLFEGTVSRILGEEPRPTSATITRTNSAPTIDGIVDSVWTAGNQYTINNNLVAGNGTLFYSDLWAVWRALYDDTNLYILVEVRDESLINDGPFAYGYGDDMVQIMLDGDHSAGTSYDGDNDFELGFRWNDPSIIRGLNSAPAPPNAQFSLVSTGNGYVLEVLLPLAEIDVLPEYGYTLGFDIHVNDDDDGGLRDTKISWYGAHDNAWLAPVNFGNAILVTGTPLAVVLADFTATSAGDHIQVTWETVSEIDNAAFNLYRSDSDAAPGELLATMPSQAPGSAQGFSYVYQDFAVQAGQTYFYWLEDVSLGGVSTLHGPVSATYQSPTAMTLSDLTAGSAGQRLPWQAMVLGLAAVAVAAKVLRHSKEVERS